MKKLLLISVVLLASVVTFAQQELVIDDFIGNTSSGIGVASGQPDWGSGVSVVTYENEQVKSDFAWIHSDWYPRAVWYDFTAYHDVSAKPIMIIKFMTTDNDNETIPVRFDLYGDGAQPYNDTIRTKMETNGKPWTFVAENGVWYTMSDNFKTNNRFYCTYWNGSIPATRVDSTKIKGFEAFSHYGDAKYNSQAGTLFIDYIKMTDTPITGSKEVLFGKENAFGLAVYPNPASEYLNVNAENQISVIKVIDNTGKILYTRSNVNDRKCTLSLTSYAKGLYIVSVMDTKGNIVNTKVRVR